MVTPELQSLGWVFAVLLAGYIYVQGKRQDVKDLKGCPECGHCVTRWHRHKQDEQAKAEIAARTNLKWLGLSDEQIDKEIEKRKGGR